VSVLCHVQVTDSQLLRQLFLGLAFGNAFSVLSLLLPRPRLAVATCQARLAALEVITTGLLRAITRAFQVPPFVGVMCGSGGKGLRVERRGWVAVVGPRIGC
jgi:hypothetical protein